MEVLHNPPRRKATASMFSNKGAFVSIRAQLLSKLASIDALLWRLFINNYFHYQLLLRVKFSNILPRWEMQQMLKIQKILMFFIIAEHLYIFVCTYISTSATAHVCVRVCQREIYRGTGKRRGGQEDRAVAWTPAGSTVFLSAGGLTHGPLC